MKCQVSTPKSDNFPEVVHDDVLLLDPAQEQHEVSEQLLPQQAEAVQRGEVASLAQRYGHQYSCILELQTKVKQRFAKISQNHPGWDAGIVVLLVSSP